MAVFVQLKMSNEFVLKYAKISNLERKSIELNGISSFTKDDLTLMRCFENAQTLLLSREYAPNYGGYYIDVFVRTYVSVEHDYSCYRKVHTLIMPNEEFVVFNDVRNALQYHISKGFFWFRHNALIFRSLFFE